jgi:hypothetical protein
MKKLVKAKTTGLFLAPDGTWILDIENAAELSSIEAKETVLIKIESIECECYYAFDEKNITEYDFTIPLCRVGRDVLSLPRLDFPPTILNDAPNVALR